MSIIYLTTRRMYMTLDTSKMAFDPFCKKMITEKYPELAPYKNLSDPFTDKIFRYICLIYDTKSPLFNILISDRKTQALKELNITGFNEDILSNQLEETRWCANLFFAVTNNPVVEIYVSLNEAFSNLLEKARTKPMSIDESQEKIAYEGISKSAESAFEMFAKIKLIREEFSKETGDIDILDLVKKDKKAAALEEVVNFAERRASKKAEENKKK